MGGWGILRCFTLVIYMDVRSGMVFYARQERCSSSCSWEVLNQWTVGMGFSRQASIGALALQKGSVTPTAVALEGAPTEPNLMTIAILAHLVRDAVLLCQCCGKYWACRCFQHEGCKHLFIITDVGLRLLCQHVETF